MLETGSRASGSTRPDGLVVRTLVLFFFVLNVLHVLYAEYLVCSVYLYLVVEQPLLSASSHMATLHVPDYQYGTPCDIHPHDPLRACDLLYLVVYKEALCLPLM